MPVVLALLHSPFMFGWARPVPVDASRLRDPLRNQSWIAAAGPASNLLLAAACAVLLGLMAGLFGIPTTAPGSGAGSDLRLFGYTLLQAGLYVNCLLALFNLIPLPPLDGSWIVLRWLRGEAALAYERLRPFGFFIVLILMNVGLGGVLGRVVAIVADRYFVLANAVLRLVRPA